MTLSYLIKCVDYPIAICHCYLDLSRLHNIKCRFHVPNEAHVAPRERYLLELVDKTIDFVR